MEITHDYVDLETAKLLKELEFDVPCQTTYNEEGEIEDCIDYTDSILFTVDDVNNALLNDFLVYLRPELWQVKKWLLLKYNMWIQVDYDCSKKEWYTVLAGDEFVFNTPEEAELENIRHCLNNIIDGK